jgi:hypothetical protein
MSYCCDSCNYKTDDKRNYHKHIKTKTHLKKNVNNVLYVIPCYPNTDNNYLHHDNMLSSEKYTSESEKLCCPICKTNFTQRSNLSRHKKKCIIKEKKEENEIIVEKLQMKLDMAEKEKEIFKKMEKEKSDLLSNFMNNANTIINKAHDNTKITAQAIQSVSMSALKYANEKYKAAPVLLPIENFNINNLNFEKKEDRAQLLEVLIYNAKLKSLDKLLGEHIIQNYKKDNPKEQSIHTTDCSRLNYLVRELFENVPSWEVDKNGIKLCSKIIKPLIDKCIELLLDYQKELLDEMADGNYKNKDTVNSIINLLMSIDKGSLENDINKYIAPHFNIIKKD